MFEKLTKETEKEFIEFLTANSDLKKYTMHNYVCSLKSGKSNYVTALKWWGRFENFQKKQDTQDKLPIEKTQDKLPIVSGIHDILKSITDSIIKSPMPENSLVFFVQNVFNRVTISHDECLSFIAYFDNYNISASTKIKLIEIVMGCAKTNTIMVIK
jgi:hypothetical protein